MSRISQCLPQHVKLRHSPSQSFQAMEESPVSPHRGPTLQAQALLLCSVSLSNVHKIQK